MRKRTSRSSGRTAVEAAPGTFTHYFGCKRHNFRSCVEICMGRVKSKYYGCATCKQIKSVQKELKAAAKLAAAVEDIK